MVSDRGAGRNAALPALAADAWSPHRVFLAEEADLSGGSLLLTALVRSPAQRSP